MIATRRYEGLNVVLVVPSWFRRILGGTLILLNASICYGEEARSVSTARQMIADSTQPASERIADTVELIRGETLRCVALPATTPLKQLEAQWKRIAKIDLLVNDLSNAPRYQLVRFQFALALIEQGKQLYRTPVAATARKQRMLMAREKLRTALFMLKDVDEEFAKRVPGPSSKPTDSDDDASLSITAITALRTNLELYLAKAYRWQALCYPAESADWYNSLGLAQEQLATLAGVPDSSPLKKQVLSEKAICEQIMKQRFGYEPRISPTLPILEPLAVAPEKVDVRAAEPTSSAGDRSGRQSEAHRAEEVAARLSSSPETRRDAYLHWSHIEARSPGGSPRWQRARKARIDLLEKLGEQGRADKLQKLTEVLYPETTAANRK
ncbi:hypothetical protein [Adhaeretor mobilis]|uniref:Uncharacterized protein n=1 Tax=Adhaeretor mobilis TaxID=1930276 RepID=A0A517N243_9BACT|nr:hypothetical protein [Adhaeretor mobilis]QDT01078.1 hypothetical protein HG15A2_44200 [Adhaeretor mobilis]